MKANKVIERIDAIRPNSYSEEIKLAWINDFEETVQKTVMLSPEIRTLSYPEDMETELLITAPYDNLYCFYLESMIDYYNREYSNYNNSVLMFETRFTEYKKAYIRGDSAIPPARKAEYYVNESRKYAEEAKKARDSVASPYIKDGNWWVGETDLGVKAEGEKGDKGDKPIKGKDYFTPEDVKQIVNEIINNGAKAKIGNVTLLASAWVGTDSPYSQVVTVEGATENSQVDLTPSVEQLAVFHEKDLAFVTENEGGVVTVYAIGQKPENDYEIQVTITEVAI